MKTAIAAVGLLLSMPRLASADERPHADTTAELTRPANVGELADAQYIFSWMDGDQLTASEAATIDFYFTRENPPTFAPGTVPDGLNGELIAEGVSVHDARNMFIWDTSRVPSGSYWIWSIVHDPEVHTPGREMISFSPGVVTIAHAGDELQPAVVLSTPDNPFRWPEAHSLDIGYRTFDPEQTCSVRLEAARREEGPEHMILLADGLPSSSNGHFEWITEDLSEGEWMLRATVTEQGTEKFVAYDRFYRFINHPLESASGDQGCTSVSVPRRGQGFTTADAALLISLLGIGVLRATCRSRRREVRTDRR